MTMSTLPRARVASPRLPSPRGPLSDFVITQLRRRVASMPPAPSAVDDPLHGDDTQLALYLCYELHYRGFAEVDERWEWEPTLLDLRRRVEESFERRLADEVGSFPTRGAVPDLLRELLAPGGDGMSLSTFMAEHGTLAQMREFAVHRSAYQLKEADPHSWALPRLSGPAKAALVEIQADEYGQGVCKDMHAELFAMTMRELGLDDTYGAYLDVLPGVTLATVNLVSLFGLHRRLRGALVGHLAVFEMTSVEPMGRYSAALRRLGMSSWARLFYDTHVVADAHHQAVAADELAAGLVRAEPDLARDVVFGAHAIMCVERAFTQMLLGAWARDQTALLRSPHVQSVA